MPDEPKSALIACPNCDGCGKVDSRDKKSWRRFSGMSNDHPDMKKINGGTGELVPVLCPACKGQRFVEAGVAQTEKKDDVPEAPYVPAVNPDAPGQLLAATRGEYGAYVAAPEVVNEKES